MTPTNKSAKAVADELARILHLVTPNSHGKPLCGEQSPDAAIGSYTEHLDDKGEWVREVFGRYGMTGRACAQCLALYPSLLWGRPGRLHDSLILQCVLKISPYPQPNPDSFSQDYKVSGFCISEDYMVRPDPSVIGQRAMYGKVALSLNVHIDPIKPQNH